MLITIAHYDDLPVKRCNFSKKKKKEYVLLDIHVSSLNDRDENIFANNVDPDEVAHNKPPHLDLHS